MAEPAYLYRHRTDRVKSWAVDLPSDVIAQAERTARVSVVHQPVALMPDAHLGKGATVGSVVATEGAILPAAVGVDIGCGMTAQATGLDAAALPDTLNGLHAGIEIVTPAGVGSAHHVSKFPKTDKALDQLMARRPQVDIPKLTNERIVTQYGTLGSGNHFVEVCLDEHEKVWVVLHSGSRGPGNLLANYHIKIAGEIERDEKLEDPDLAYFLQGTPEFEEYIAAMLWAQDYAYHNRAAMMARIMAVFWARVGATAPFVGPTPIQCHHNYAAFEDHGGKSLWVTRKGAINADLGQMGVIPGSMATGSYIVSGLGNAASYRSASHGAGRRMSRGKAKRELTQESLVERMEGIAWNDSPKALLDEHPESYKDLDEVMGLQRDLVKIEHRLTTILNFKGV